MKNIVLGTALCASLGMSFKMQANENALMVADPQQCIEQKCPNEWAACQKDPKCVPALQDCQKKCGTKTSCWELCLPGKGSQPAIDVAKCAQKNNCLQVPEPSTALMVADPQQCIEQKCPNEWAACQKDPKCVPALQDCQKKCGTKTSCWELCLPGKGSQAAIDVAKCAQKNNCLQVPEPSTALMVADPQQCIEQKCPNEWAACQKDPKCVPALQDCQKKCGTKTSCWELCLPGKGSQAAIDVAKCAQKNNCLQTPEPSTALMVADPQQCIEQKCPNEWAACQKDPKCVPALQDCQKKCGTKTSCWELCLPGKGSQAAIDVAKCAQKNNCLQVPEPSTALMVADPQQCIEEKCPNEWATCQKDPKCIPALQDCQKKCGTKTSCWEICLPGKGSQPAIDVAKCAQKNNCLQVPAHPFEQCISKKCSSAFAECLHDDTCRSELRVCRNPAKVWDFSF